jgi:hypothetical protein
MNAGPQCSSALLTSEDLIMSLIKGSRAVATEKGKLSLALGVTLIPLFLATLAADHIRNNGLVSFWSFVSLLKDVWF